METNKCIICEQDYPEEDLQLYCEKNVCSDCITELLKQDLIGGRDTEKLKQLIAVYEEFDAEVRSEQVLSQEDKDTIKDWAEGELEMKPEQFTNKDHYQDYMNRVKRILRYMERKNA